MSTYSDAGLNLMKARQNRSLSDTTLDNLYLAMLAAAESELARKGIALQDDDDDKMLLVDYATWRYQSRDQAGASPAWLRLRIRERWLSNKGRNTQ
jgi:hypothetical protein